MARLSIIIPHSGSVQRLENTLVSVLENRPDDSQIVVVQSEVYDDPYDLKGEVTFVYTPIGTDNVRCLNVGIDMSDAPVVHLLLPGIEVTPGWADAALRHFADPTVAAVAPLLVHGQTDGILTAGLEYRPSGAVRPVGHGQSATKTLGDFSNVAGPDPRAAFYRKSMLRRVDRFCIGFDEQTAGADLALRLIAAGGRCVVESDSRVRAVDLPRRRTSAFCRAMQNERIFWRWAPHGGWLRGLTGHLGQAVVDVASEFPGPGMLGSLLGHLLGACRSPAQRREHRRLMSLCAEPEQTPGDVVPLPHFSMTGRALCETPVRRRA
ncbi:MAG: hypothetical protein JW888_07780 [Pirellulales bacterium]|nr:hypothetical protein [Pirellulales bacterium]